MVTKKIDNVPVKIPTPVGGEPVVASVNFRIVKSSNVTQVGWDEAGNMYVKYISSPGYYVYFGTTRQKAVAAAYAESVGQFINQRIKPYFEVLKLGAA